MAAIVHSGISIGIANLPNQLHRIVTKRGVDFTILVAGESGLGKTTFINTLLTTSLAKHKEYSDRYSEEKDSERTVHPVVYTDEMQEKGFTMRLNVIDTPGFGDHVDNSDCWKVVEDIIGERYHEYLSQEGNVQRRERNDPRVHACLYFLPPTGQTLRVVDVQAMQALSGMVNLIPVIAKADTLTPNERTLYKRRILDALDANNIATFGIDVDSEDEKTTQLNADIQTSMPFAIVCSEKDIINSEGNKVRGRQYPWGYVEVENDKVSDFRRLRNLLVRTHMHELIDTTSNVHYENYRSRILTKDGTSEPLNYGMLQAHQQMTNNLKTKEDDLRKRFTEQVRLEENRFRAWEQRLTSERDRLNKQLAEQHNQIRQLQEDIGDLEKGGK